ncbi:MAG TPA: hypothetical protein VEK79_21965 [Thermoanaerobaculia bacterium]|nr:hypothetical protein [Thermoanaerobaculia bacterium]
MTTPMLMIDHPSEETLAAFVDHRLEERVHQQTTQHLADCGECRELVLMAADFQESEKVVPGRFGKGRLAAIAAAVAIAAGLAVVFLPPIFQDDMGDVITAARALDERPSEGRLAGHPYKKEPPTYRSGGTPDPSDDDYYAKRAELFDIVSDAKDPHVRGVALLFVTEKPEDVEAAVQTLEEAYSRARGAERDAVAIDLAAALLLRARWAPQVAGRAYALSNDVFTRTRSADAAWNRAVALEKLQRDAEAIAAWNDYLKLDPASEWAREARKNIEYLRELSPAPPARPPA